jgi:uncharacterized protein YgbK (DUF1537 family)
MQKNSLLLAFYGDDFTGSTDAMEALAINGYRTVLFLDVPTPEMIQQFEGICCIGVAGTSRAKGKMEMELELRPVFERLSKIAVPVIHYKTCSTFDSSPEVGNIGKAFEIAMDYYSNQQIVPLLVGAPPLGRYTLFGQHFARMHDTVYRLDRHPTMSKHPITPMNEADLRLHLSKQMSTPKNIGLMNILELAGGYEEVKERYDQKAKMGFDILLFDVLDDARMVTSGRLIWENSQESPQFVVGSSGMEYALTSYWKSIGLQPPTDELLTVNVRSSNQVLVVSGSCSPITQQQIEIATQAGFQGIKIQVEQIMNTEELPQSLLNDAICYLKEGRSVILYTAFGPEDEAIVATREHFNRMGIDESQSGEFIGRQLGKWTLKIMNESGVRRVVVAGGDTSGFVTREMNIFGLEMLLPVSPGAPLCKTYSMEDSMNGIEMALKGGQFGSPDYFLKVKCASS